MDRGIPPLLVGSRGRPRAAPRPHESSKTSQQERKAAVAVRTANAKEKVNENQSDERVRGRPGQSLALLYRCPGLCEEDRLQPGALSLADSVLPGGPGWHRAATRA